MTLLTVNLRHYGSTGSEGLVEAIPRTKDGFVPGNDIMALGPWRASINGSGTLAGQGTLDFPADEFPDLAWSFHVHWRNVDKRLTFGPYTYAEISASGVTSLADLIEVEVLEYVATSTLVQRVEALEAGGGGGSYDDTELRGLIDAEETARADGDAANATAISTHTGRTDNPHAVTKAQVGLANVDNTSDANKPISTATQTALNGKAATGHTHGVTDLTATGTRNGTTVLHGDNTWKVPAGGGPLTGTGSPEGVVTAPVTTEYVDTAATNGAVSWVKASGTGNTGWRVTYGDTGWRRVDSANLVKGYMLIRRVNSTVYIGFRGGDFDSVEVASASGQTIINSQPTGFTSLAAYVEAMSRDGAAFNGFVYVGEGLIIFRGMTQVTLIRPGLCIHPTADPWPSTLPGIPA